MQKTDKIAKLVSSKSMQDESNTVVNGTDEPGRKKQRSRRATLQHQDQAGESSSEKGMSIDDLPNPSSQREGKKCKGKCLYDVSSLK